MRKVIERIKKMLQNGSNFNKEKLTILFKKLEKVVRCFINYVLYSTWSFVNIIKILTGNFSQPEVFRHVSAILKPTKMRNLCENQSVKSLLSVYKNINCCW